MDDERKQRGIVMQSRWVHLKDEGFEALVDLESIRYARWLDNSDYPYKTEKAFIFSIAGDVLVLGSRSWADAVGSMLLGQQLWDAYRAWCEEKVNG